MKKWMLAGVISVCAFSSVQAEEKTDFMGQGHIGLGYGVTNYELKGQYLGTDVKLESSPKVFELFWKGYVTRHFALEARFGADGGKDELDVSFGPASLTVDELKLSLDHYFTVNAVFSYPVGQVSPRLTVGYNKLAYELSVDGMGELVDTSDDVYVGVGVDVHVSPKWGIALDYSNHYSSKDDDLDITVDSFRIGLFHTY